MEEFNRSVVLNPNDKDRIVEAVQKECNKAEIIAGNLLHAPLACCILEALSILVSCTKDPSLTSGDPDEKFNHLSQTKTSFKSSLCRVIHQMCDAFRTAHSSMTTIEYNLSEMPELMIDCLKALNNLNEGDSQNIIENALNIIGKAADKCVTAAKDADKEFKNALECIQELSEAVIATQGRKEKRAEDAAIEYKEQQRLKIQKEEQLKELNMRTEQQKKEIEDARDQFKLCMAQSSQFSEVFGAMFIDNLRTLGETIVNVGGSLGYLPQKTLEMIDAADLFSPNETNTTVRKNHLLGRNMEKTLYDFLENILNQPYEKIVDQANVLIHTLVFAETHADGSLLKQLLRDARKTMINALQCIERKDPGCQEQYEKAKAEVGINLKHYKNTMDEINAERQTKSEERQTLMRTRLDNLKISRDELSKVRETYDKLYSDKYDTTKKLSEIITNLQRLEIEEVDLKDVLEYLQEGIEQLTQVRIAWEKIVNFFSHIKNIVDGPLITNVLGMSKSVQSITDNPERNVSEQQQKILLRQVIKACAFSNILMQCAELYKTISNKYISSIMNSSISNMALKRFEAKGKRHLILSNFNKIKEDVQKTIDDHTKQISNNVYGEFKKHGFDVGRAIEDKKNNRHQN